jgi:hypothetical protein
VEFGYKPVNLYDLAVAGRVLVVFFEPLAATILMPVTLPLANGFQVIVAEVAVVTTATLVALVTGVSALASMPRIPIVSEASKTAAKVFLLVFMFFT